MNNKFNPDEILYIYEKFKNGEISSETANEYLNVFTEMKSKEEYRKQKVLGGKDKNNSYFGATKRSNSRYIYDAKDNNGEFSVRIGNRNSNVKLKTGGDRILVNNDDFKKYNAKEIAARVSHERGHQLYNKMVLNPDGSSNISLDKKIEDKIKEVLKNVKWTLDGHLTPDELRADYNSYKRVGAKATISSLEKDRKRQHRIISDGKCKDNTTHEDIDKEINARIKFIKSLKDIH